MAMNKKKLVIGGLSLFITGIIVGALGMGLFTKTGFGRLARLDKDSTAFFMDRLDHALSLTQEQRTRITPVMDELLGQIREARRPCSEKEDAVVQAGVERISRELTPDQVEKYKTIMARIAEHRRKFRGQ